MLRAVLCSFDWKSQTLYRESVLRMETPSIGRMNRIRRVRFGFQRPNPPRTFPRDGVNREDS